MQQFAYAYYRKKCHTDGFMIIDAMDLFYTNRFDGFCTFVSSDSDFTVCFLLFLSFALKKHSHSLRIFKKCKPRSF